MPDFSRRETFGRFGTAPMYLNKELASTPFTANATVVHPIGPPARKAYFSGGTVSCTTVAVDADGTCLVEFAKYDASATAYVALTTGYNIEGLTTLIGSAFIPAIATLTATCSWCAASATPPQSIRSRPRFASRLSCSRRTDAARSGGSSSSTERYRSAVAASRRKPRLALDARR
jgi:hypothetical protein